MNESQYSFVDRSFYEKINDICNRAFNVASSVYPYLGAIRILQTHFGLELMRVQQNIMVFISFFCGYTN